LVEVERIFCEHGKNIAIGGLKHLGGIVEEENTWDA